MTSSKDLLKLFKAYSSKQDEELISLIDKYIDSGRRRKTIFKAFMLIAIFSAVFGVITAIIKNALESGDDFYLRVIVGGILGAFSIITFNLIHRNDIKRFLQKNE